MVFVPAVVMALSFSVTLALAPAFLKRLRSRGFLVPDMYKEQQPLVVTHLGLLILATAMGGLSALFLLRPLPPVILSLVIDPLDPLHAAELALFTICGYGVVGALDDRYPLTHWVKAAVPLTLGLPAVFLASTRSVAFVDYFSFLQSQQTIVILFVVPMYILVVTNLVNMHSGFNGLQSGLSLILMGTLALRLTISGDLERNLALLVVAGSVAALYPFNRYPARAIEGNVGSFLAGATIGVTIVANGWYLAGAVMLAPHILDFLLFAYTKVAGLPFVKFGVTRPDGVIEAPYPFKLKFLFPYYFPLTERQTVRLMYMLSATACGFSLLVWV